MSMEVGSSQAYLAGPKHSWWSTNSSKEKTLIVACGIISILAIIFFMCTIALGSKKYYEPSCASFEKNSKDGVCDSDVCRQAAFSLKMNVNESVDPCEDFYSFACGGFASVHGIDTSTTILSAQKLITDIKGPLNVIPIAVRSSFLEAKVMNLKTDNLGKYRERTFKQAEGLLHTSDPEVEKNYATKTVLYMFNKCLYPDKNGLESTANMIVDILGATWPMAVGDKWNESTFDWATSLARLTRLHPEPIVGVGVTQDIKNFTKPTLMMVGSPLKFDIPTKIKDIICKLVTNCSENKLLIKDLEDLNRFKLPREYSSNGETEKPDVLKSAEQSVQSLAILSVKELQQKIPQLDWSVFFRTLVAGTGFEITDDFRITAQISSLQNVVSTFEKNKRLMANVIAFNIISYWGKLYSTEISQTWSPEIYPAQLRDGLCFQFVNKYLGFAIGKLYMNKYLPEQTVNEISDVTEDLKKSFRKLLLKAEWMDESTKKSAVKKVDNMKSLVASPQWVFKDDLLTSFYNEIGDVKDKSFKESSHSVASNFLNQYLRTLNKPFDKDNFWPSESAIEMNAKNFLLTNSMYFYLGFLKNPFYVSGRPRALKYGYFGYIPGHEITHGFDSNGKDFDENGILNNWWDSASLAKFQKGEDCFRDQYSNIKDDQTGTMLNGALTLTENIADNGGIRAAYQAFKDAPSEKNSKLIGFEEYSEEQIFFIAAAQTWCSSASDESLRQTILKSDHSPDKYRVLVPFRNFEEFSESFRCKPYTNMNPKTKCEIW